MTTPTQFLVGAQHCCAPSSPGVNRLSYPFVVAQLVCPAPQTATPVLACGSIAPTRRMSFALAFFGLCTGAALLRPISATRKPQIATVFSKQHNPIEINQNSDQPNPPRQILH